MNALFVYAYLLFLILYLLATAGLGRYEARYSLVEDPIHRWTRWIRVMLFAIAGLSFIFFITLEIRL